MDEATADSSSGTEILERKIRLSRLTLLFEQIWPRLWLIIAVIGLFILVSLAGLWQILSPELHQFVLGLFGISLVAAPLSFFLITWPQREEALRRIERNSGVPHRPASSYEDQLSSDVDGETSTIWTAHKKRLAKLLGKLKVGGPRPRVDVHDPFALRALLMVTTIALLVISGNSAQDRIRSAFKFSGEGREALSVRVDAWVTPPAFTKRAPIMLTDGAKTVISNGHQAKIYEVPERSQLIIRVAGTRVSSYYVTASKGAGKSERIKSRSVNEAGDLAEFRLSLDETVTIKLSKESYEAFSWNFNVIADEDPKITLTSKPSLSVRGSLKLEYEVSDDYGVSSAAAGFALVEGDAASAKNPPKGKSKNIDPYIALFDEPLKFFLKLAKKNARQTHGKTFKDVSSHPWAGLRVRMVLTAKDQARQVGRSEPHEFVLPQRNFTKPMAKAIVEQRRNLVKNPRAHRKVARALDALTIAPQRFIPDKQVYLAIRTAYWRLKNAPNPENVKSVFDQLWDVALRIEDGDLSGAERALRTAQENLQRALQENASNEEIKELMKELRQAMSQFLQALARKQAKNGSPPNAQNGQGPNKVLTAKDLDRMMRNIERMLRSGSRETAQQMLSQLRELLEQMQTGNQSAGNRGSQQMMKSAQELGKLIGEQKKLLDDTFQRQRQGGNQQGAQNRGPRGQQGQRGQQGGQFGQRGRQGQAGRQGSQGRDGRSGEQGGGDMLGARQNQLRGSLGRLMDEMRGMGIQPPKQLGGAGQAMGNAERALGKGALGRATRQQSLALDRLRKGTRDLVEQAMKGMAQRLGRNGRDPLGRAQQTTGPDLGMTVKVPDEIDVQKAREILEELRRRLSDPSRPLLELDYIERLLRRF